MDSQLPIILSVQGTATTFNGVKGLQDARIILLLSVKNKPSHPFHIFWKESEQNCSILVELKITSSKREPEGAR